MADQDFPSKFQKEFFFTQNQQPSFLDEKSFYHTSIQLFKTQKYRTCYFIQKT